MSGAWEKQLSFPTWQQYQSPKASQTIWRSKPSRVRFVSDRTFIRKTRGHSDAFGNVIRNDPRVIAKIMVEKHIRTLAPAEQAAITPGQKWHWVDSIISKLTAQQACA
jgi:hypothetical protein